MHRRQAEQANHEVEFLGHSSFCCWFQSTISGEFTAMASIYC